MYVWDGAKAFAVADPMILHPSEGLQEVKGVVGFPHGYRSASETLLSDATFYSAHRGGSADWPEMSLHAYTQAAVRGVGILEVSVAKTSDGVWFGLHDRDLLRTSGVALTAAAATWEQVRAHRISPPSWNPDQPSRPYMRLEELVEAYGRTHTIMFDPKYELGSMGTLISFLTSRMSADRLIGKYYYTSLSFANACKSAGIRTWGYAYEADLPAMLDPKYLVWDSFGMDHAASQSAWNQVKALGKPVIGHICRTPAEMSSALAKGADGLQVSGVRSIPELQVLVG
jgi:hypothetical protein